MFARGEYNIFSALSSARAISKGQLCKHNDLFM